MVRSWNSEWEVLDKAERAAFQEMLDAMGPVTAIVAHNGPPDLTLLDKADLARMSWLTANAAIDKFISDFGASV